MDERLMINDPSDCQSDFDMDMNEPDSMVHSFNDIDDHCSSIRTKRPGVAFAKTKSD